MDTQANTHLIKKEKQESCPGSLLSQPKAEQQPQRAQACSPEEDPRKLPALVVPAQVSATELPPKACSGPHPPGYQPAHPVAPLPSAPICLLLHLLSTCVTHFSSICFLPVSSTYSSSSDAHRAHQPSEKANLVRSLWQQGQGLWELAGPWGSRDWGNSQQLT